MSIRIRHGPRARDARGAAVLLIRALLLVISSSWIVGGGIYALAKDRRLTFTREKALAVGLAVGAIVLLARV
jgi:hypothetical protein